MNSGTDSVWALVLGLMLTVFGGFALCYGVVVLGERVVARFHARRVTPAPAPTVRRAA